MADTLLTVVERGREASSNAVAVAAWDCSPFCRDLRAHLRGFARHLHGAGIRHQDADALYANKACWTVIAVLAILEIGAVWVPLDLQHNVTTISDARSC